MADATNSAAAAKSADKSAAKTVPNVKLAAKADPLGAGAVTVGMKTICTLPSEDEQRAGFYCEQAAELIAAFPDRFKVIVEKG